MTFTKLLEIWYNCVQCTSFYLGVRHMKDAIFHSGTKWDAARCIQRAAERTEPPGCDIKTILHTTGSSVINVSLMTHANVIRPFPSRRLNLPSSKIFLCTNVTNTLIAVTRAQLHNQTITDLRSHTRTLCEMDASWAVSEEELRIWAHWLRHARLRTDIQEIWCRRIKTKVLTHRNVA